MTIVGVHWIPWQPSRKTCLQMASSNLSCESVVSYKGVDIKFSRDIDEYLGPIYNLNYDLQQDLLNVYKYISKMFIKSKIEVLEIPCTKYKICLHTCRYM